MRCLVLMAAIATLSIAGPRPKYSAEFADPGEVTFPVGECGQGAFANGVAGAINSKGNATGWIATANDTCKVAFYWPKGGKLIIASPAKGCDYPISIDDKDRIGCNNFRIGFGEVGRLTLTQCSWGGSTPYRVTSANSQQHLFTAANIDSGIAVRVEGDSGRCRVNAVSSYPAGKGATHHFVAASGGHSSGGWSGSNKPNAGEDEIDWPNRAAIWTKAGRPPQRLRMMRGGTEPRSVRGMNRQGVAVGGAIGKGGTSMGYVARAGFWGYRRRLLPAVGNDNHYVATAINDQYTITGAFSGSRSGIWWRDGLRWRVDYLDNLVDRRNDCQFVEAQAINDGGQIVGSAMCSGRPMVFRLTPLQFQPERAPKKSPKKGPA